MNKQVDKIIESKRGEMIATLKESVSIRSVKGDPKPGAPFGTEVKRALMSFLAKAEQLGFSCYERDGYYGCIDYGEGKETLAVLAHLDVVPEGEGWTHAPYGGEIENERMYGRGTMDDKGPAVSALYALYAIKEAGFLGDRKVRLILGCDEESGCNCINHYKKLEKEPEIAFSPDAEYPVVNSEKGIIHAAFEKKYPTEIKIDCGTVPNVVPGIAKIFVPLSKTEVEAAASSCGFPVSISEAKNGVNIEITGLSAHASMPESGDNALISTLELLLKLNLKEQDLALIREINAAFDRESHGKLMDLDFSDASGRTTVSPSILKIDENGLTMLVIDLRLPTSLNLNDVKAKIEKSLPNLKLIHASLTNGHFVDKDSELVTKLLASYNGRKGGVGEPKAIGGGTYAKAFKNAVAFGCEMPGEISTVHMPDEFLDLNELMFNAYVMADAIMSLMVK
ncbi:MAG: Sapep family Mn(2+)-dependent dipeptidase [Clostridia bacterium]